jgi:hypothetical protein
MWTSSPTATSQTEVVWISLPNQPAWSCEITATPPPTATPTATPIPTPIPTPQTGKCNVWTLSPDQSTWQCTTTATLPPPPLIMFRNSWFRSSNDLFRSIPPNYYRLGENEAGLITMPDGEKVCVHTYDLVYMDLYNEHSWEGHQYTPMPNKSECELQKKGKGKK